MSSAPRTDARRLTSDERREQIVEAAIAVFGAKGYVGSTTDDVAKAAGVSQPYVVRLFGTKENLFVAALECVLDLLLHAFESVPRAVAPADDAAEMGRAYMGLLDVRGLHQLLSQSFLLGAHPVIGPLARAGFTRIWDYTRDRGLTSDEAYLFLAKGMLVNTMIGLRLAESYGENPGLTELFDQCFPQSIALVLAESPRVADPW